MSGKKEREKRSLSLACAFSLSLCVSYARVHRNTYKRNTIDVQRRYMVIDTLLAAYPPKVFGDRYAYVCVCVRAAVSAFVCECSGVCVCVYGSAGRAEAQNSNPFTGGLRLQ